MRTVIAASIALLSLCVADRAYGSPLLELTGGFGGTGGLQPRHAGPSSASTYFNPALLTDADSGLTAGVLLLDSNIGVSVGARSPGNAVPDRLSSATHVDGTPLPRNPLATDLLQNGRPADPETMRSALTPRPRQRAGSGDSTLTYTAVGLVLKLFKERLGLGFYGLLPNKNFTTMRSGFVDEREQFFSNSLHPELYGDRLTAISVAFAGAVRLTDTLSLGLGATLGLVAKAHAPVYVSNAAELSKIDLNTDVQAEVSLVPHAGVSWRPGRRWHLTGTVHAPQKLDVVATFKFLLATGVEQGSGMAFTYFYQPWQAGVGLGYDFYTRGDRTWTASGSMLYGRWSKYIDRQSTRPEGAYTWNDTLTGALGVRMQDERLSLALDGQYQPTPVPKQTGRTNYVDNNRLGMSASVAYSFSLWQTTIKLGSQLQVLRLLERAQHKIKPPTNAQGVNRTPQLAADEVPDDLVVQDTPLNGREGLQTNNPGWPSFSSLGWITAFGVYLTVLI